MGVPFDFSTTQMMMNAKAKSQLITKSKFTFFPIQPIPFMVLSNSDNPVK